MGGRSNAALMHSHHEAPTRSNRSSGPAQRRGCTPRTPQRMLLHIHQPAGYCLDMQTIDPSHDHQSLISTLHLCVARATYSTYRAAYLIESLGSLNSSQLGSVTASSHRVLPSPRRRAARSLSIRHHWSSLAGRGGVSGLGSGINGCASAYAMASL
jgi:hypothetical protein